MTHPTPAPDPPTLLDRWPHLVTTQEALGECHRPGCDGQLRALPPTVIAGITWLEAECDTCHAGIGLPDGKRADTPRTVAPVVAGRWVAPVPDWRAAASKDP